MGAKPILLIADSHVGQTEGDEEPLVRLLDALEPARFESVYLLGDVFHYLIGDPKFMTPAITSTLGAFRRLRERGLATYYVEGNRDFYLKGSFLEPTFTSVELAFRLETPRGSFFLTHGDRINDRDYPYRFWRFVSKNPLAYAAMRAIPERSARKLVSNVEGRLARSNFKHKRRLPEEKIRAFAARRWDEGDYAVLFGHFHVEWREEADGKLVAVVPAWCETERVGLVEPDGGYRTLASSELPLS